MVMGVGAQTRVDLRTQGKNVDFSGVPTKPFRTGTTLPVTCSVGETFFKTDAPAGKNFYGCTAPNKWTPQAPPDLPDAAGQTGKVLTNDGSDPLWSSLAGDVSGAANAMLVQGLQGRPLSAANPTGGSVLKWNGATNQWEPGIQDTTLIGDASGDAASTIVKGLQGRLLASAAPGDGQMLMWSAASNQWQPGSAGTTLTGDASGPSSGTVVKGLLGRALSTASPADGQALKWNATLNQWEPGAPSTTLAGDAAGPSGSTVVKSLQGHGLSAASPADGQALKWNGTLNQWEPGTPSTTLAGDANGPAGSTVVKGLQGLPVAANSPVDGQALKWNGTLNRWEPGTPSTTLTGDASGPAGGTVVKAIQGRSVSATAPANGQALEWSGVTSQWEPTLVANTVSGDAAGLLSSVVVQGLQGRAVSAVRPTDGQALTWNGSVNQWAPANVSSTLAGDASGPAGNTVVRGLQGRALSIAAPVDGQALQWNGTASQWEPGASNTTLAGDASGPVGSNVVRGLQGRAVSTGTPADGQSLKWNSASNQWEPGTPSTTLAGDASGPAGSTVVQALQGRSLSAAGPADGAVLKWNAASNRWEPGTATTTLAGDATGPAGSTVVAGIQGRTVSTAAPADGQTLRWNNALSQWQPGGPVANYSAPFTSQTSLVIPGSDHGYNTANLLVQCYDATGTVVEPDSISIDSGTYDVQVAFSTAQSGRCVIGGGGTGNSGSTGGGGDATITSVFGRTGVVTGQSGDYGFSQISGVVVNSQLGSGIDAAKIGAGTVSSTTFGYIGNARSDVQAQLDGKSATTHSHTAAGDVTGDLGSTVVTRIRNKTVAATAAQDGQVLTWNATSSQWEPQTASAVPSSLAVTLSSPTVLTIGARCSPATPCPVRFGTTVYSIQASATATITGGTGPAFIYAGQNGTITVGHNLTVVCSTSCQSQQGITGFPAGVIPLATWSASNGTWAAQGSDLRASLATTVLNAGQGMVIVDSGGLSTIAVDTAIVPTYLTGSATLSFPAISNGACSDDSNIPVFGASPSDTVTPGWPGTLQRGLFGIMVATSIDTVSVRLCNLSGMTIYPATAVYKAMVIRSF